MVLDLSNAERGALARRRSVQRDLDQERRRQAFSAAAERKRQTASSVRVYRAETGFKDVQVELRAKHTSGADAEEVVQLSMELNARLAIIAPDPKSRTWFSLFRYMDEDDSGLISYHELVRMVRNHLKLENDAMPLSRLQRLFLTLDRDGSGQLCTGEFGAFMRLGERFTQSEKTGELKPIPPPPQGETRMTEAAKRRRARNQQRADDNSAAVNGETVARAHSMMLPRFQQETQANDQEADRLERELLQLTKQNTTIQTLATKS